VRRVAWFVSGAVGAVAVLVAAPDLYTRLREAVAGGPVDGEDDWADEDLSDDVPFAPEARAEPASTSPPPPPPADEQADELRSRIGESRERMRQKAVAATPEPDAADEDDTAETS
jgi:hypothetical protein